MARGSITRRTRKTTGKAFYEARVVVGAYAGSARPKEEGRSFDTRREAQAWLNTRVAEIEQGVAVPRTKQTVDDLLAYWMEHYVEPTVTPVTQESYRYTLKHLLASPLAGVLAQEVKPDQVQRWYTQKRKAGCGVRTLKECHLRLSQAYKFAVRQGLVSRNPLDAVTTPRLARTSMQVWTIPQLQAFLRVASGSSYGPVYLTMIHTGLRRGEVLGLRWCDVDLDKGIITINQTVSLVGGKAQVKPTPKNKSSNRTLPIGPTLVDALRLHKADRPVPAVDGSDVVFHTRAGTPIYPRNLLRDFEHWRAVADLPKLTLHGLRHTNASHLLLAGESLKVVSERLGHSTASTTANIYAHVAWEQHTDTAARADALFGARKTV